MAATIEDWNDWDGGNAPDWVRELMEKPLTVDELKREVVKLRLRVGKLESFDDKLAKRIYDVEVHLGLERR